MVDLEWLKKNYRLLSVALALVMVGVFLLADSKSGGLEHYRAMLADGRIDYCRSALTRELDANPQWHDARELLIELEIASHRPDAALEHLLFLRLYDRGEETARQLLRSLPLMPWGSQDRFFARLSQEFDQGDGWSQRFFIQTAIAVNRPELVNDILEAMSSLILIGKADANELQNIILSVTTHRQIDAVSAVNVLSAPNAQVRECALELAFAVGDLSATIIAWHSLAELAPEASLLGTWPRTLDEHLDVAWRLGSGNQEFQRVILLRWYDLDWAGKTELIEKLADSAPDHLELQALAAMAAGQWQQVFALEKQPGFAPLNQEKYGREKLARLQQNPYIGSGTTSQMVAFIQAEDVAEAYKTEPALGSWYAHVLGLLREGGHTPADARAYSQLRREMFWASLESQEVYPAHDLQELLAGATGEELWQLAVLWFNAHHPHYQELYQPSLEQVLVRLAGLPDWAHQVQYLKGQMNIKRPQAELIFRWQLPWNLTDLWLSPGNHFALVCVGRTEYRLYNMETGDYTLVPVGGIGQVFWSNDPRVLVAVSGEEFFWFVEGALQGNEIIPGATPMGWSADNFLYAIQLEGGEWQVRYHNLTNRSQGPMGEPVNGQPHLTPQGEVAWAASDGSNLHLTRGGREYLLPDSARLAVVSWNTSGDKLLLQEREATSWGYRGHGYFIWSLDGGSLVKLEVPGFMPVSWRDDQRLVGLTTLEHSLGYMVVVYNTTTGKLHNTGLNTGLTSLLVGYSDNQRKWHSAYGVLLSGVSGQKVFQTSRNGLVVYNLP